MRKVLSIIALGVGMGLAALVACLLFIPAVFNYGPLGILSAVLFLSFVISMWRLITFRDSNSIKTKD